MALNLADATAKLPVGAQCRVKNFVGTIKYVGVTKFQPGVPWVGIALDKKVGKNDGSVRGERYFTCPEGHGIFVRPENLDLLGKDGKPVSVGPKAPAKPAAKSTEGSSSTQQKKLVAKAAIRPVPNQVPKKPAVPAPVASEVQPEPEIGNKNEMVLKKALLAQKSELEKSKQIIEVSKKAIVQTKRESDEYKAKMNAALLEMKKRLDSSAQDNAKMKEAVKMLSVKLHQAQAKNTEQKSQVAPTSASAPQSDTKLRELAIELKKKSEALQIVARAKNAADLKNQKLLAENERLRDELEEAQLDKEILQNELEESFERSNTTVAAAISSTDNEKIQTNMERFKLALLACVSERDEARANVERWSKETEKIQSLESSLKSLREQIMEKDDIIDELKDRLDLAEDSTEMLETLTEENALQQEELTNLQSAVTDLETMVELSDELEQNYIETERELESALKEKETRLKDLQTALKAQSDALKSHERASIEYRGLIKNLKEEMVQLTQKQLNGENLPQEALVRQQEMTLRETDVRAARILSVVSDIELKAKDRELKRIRAYVPNDLVADDIDGVLAVLHLERIIAKAKLAAKKLEESGMEPTESDEENHANSIHDLLLSAAVCEAIVTARLAIIAVEMGGETIWKKVNLAVHTLSDAERVMDELLGRLKEGNISVGRSPLKDIESIAVGGLRAVLPLLLQEESSLPSCEVNGDGRRVLLLARAFRIEIKSKLTAVDLLAKAEESGVAAELEAEFGTADADAVSASKVLDELHKVEALISSVIASSQQICIHTDDLSDGRRLAVSFASSESLEEARTAIVHARQAFFEICADGVEESDEPGVGFGTIAGWVEIEKCLAKSHRELDQVVISLKEGAIEASNLPPMPFETRAIAIREELSQASSLRAQLNTLQEAQKNSIKNTKILQAELKDAKSRADIYERRVDTLQKKMDEADSLLYELEALRKQDKIYEEAIDSIQNDSYKLERENVQLRAKLEAQSTKPGAGGDPSLLADVSHADHVALSARVGSLRSTVRYLKAKLSREIAIRARINSLERLQITSSAFQRQKRPCTLQPDGSKEVVVLNPFSKTVISVPMNEMPEKRRKQIPPTLVSLANLTESSLPLRRKMEKSTLEIGSRSNNVNVGRISVKSSDIDSGSRIVPVDLSTNELFALHRSMLR